MLKGRKSVVAVAAAASSVVFSTVGAVVFTALVFVVVEESVMSAVVDVVDGEGAVVLAGEETNFIFDYVWCNGAVPSYQPPRWPSG